jgi:hypothetical protein
MSTFRKLKNISWIFKAAMQFVSTASPVTLRFDFKRHQRREIWLGRSLACCMLRSKCMQYGSGGMPKSCQQLRAEGHDWLVIVEAGFSGSGMG